MRNFLANVPSVVKNIIIINVLMLLITLVTGNFMYDHFAAYYPASPLFKPWQLITHIFMHGGLFHLFFNMYALWLFGCPLEYQWGSKKFLLFYLVTGLGAALFYLLVLWLQMLHIESTMLPDTLTQMQAMVSAPGFADELRALHAQGQTYSFVGSAGSWFEIMTRPMVGASGALYGVLAAFGVLYPNVRLQFIFPPVSFKAKWAVVIMGGITFLLDFSGDVAHFAHLGGALVGFLLTKYWQRRNRIYYN